MEFPSKATHSTMSYFFLFLVIFFGYTNCSGNNGISQQSNSLNNTLQKSRSNMFWLCATVSSSDRTHICFFFIQIDYYLCLHSGNSSGSIYDTCGPRRHMDDVLRLFIVSYKKESTKSYPKRHMEYCGRWWCGSCITAWGKRQWFRWKFTGINLETL